MLKIVKLLFFKKKIHIRNKMRANQNIFPFEKHFINNFFYYSLCISIYERKKVQNKKKLFMSPASVSLCVFFLLILFYVFYSRFLFDMCIPFMCVTGCGHCQENTDKNFNRIHRNSSKAVPRG